MEACRHRGARVTTHYRYDEPRDGYHNIGQLTRQDVRYPARDGQPARSHVQELNYGTEGLLRWENHRIDDGVHPVRTLDVSRWYKRTGDMAGWCLPETPGSTSRICRGGFHYDAARRLVAMDGLIDRVDYDATGYRTGTDYSNGARVTWQHDRRRGWLTRLDAYQADGRRINGAIYSRSASGRVTRQNTAHGESDYDFTYDHAGRLLRADNWHADQGHHDRAFRYDPAGNMTFHSRIGDYRYDTGRQRLTRAGDWAFQYDANGNTTRGLYGKAMTYDGENRPLSVTLNGVTTRYVYAADGSRLLRIDRAGTAQQTTTAYFGPMEIRNFGEGRNEEVVTYPHPEVRRVDGEPGILVHDQLGSVITLFNAEGERAINKHYRPYGQVSQWVTDPATAAEDQGFVGQRHDWHAGLIYLNARYMDPELGRFIQPDWWDVRIAGTNRYAYSFNDPVNLADPGGNVPYNPGGDTSTGWSDRDNDGVEHYDSRRDRRSSDYLNQDGDGRHSIGIVGHDTDRNDYGGRSHIRGGVDSDSYESSRRGRYAENQWRALNNQAYATRMRALEMELAVGLASVVPVVRGARAGIMFVGTAARGWSLRWGMNVPRGWTRAPNRKGFGYRWSDPQNPGNGIRVDAANPSSPFASQRVPHVVVRSGGAHNWQGWTTTTGFTKTKSDARSHTLIGVQRMDDMEQSIGTLQYPNMRLELLDYLDGCLEAARKCRKTRSCGAETLPELDFLIHFLFDDTDIASDPEKTIGVFLKSKEEAFAVYDLAMLFDAILKTYGRVSQNAIYVQAQEWDGIERAILQTIELLNGVVSYSQT